MSIRVEVWGDYACFSRPEMKVERVSYDVMTPSAARGLIEAVYWHPGLRWVIDRIHVCAPIRFTNIRRNEVKDVISAQKAHFDLVPQQAAPGDNPGKFQDIVKRRLGRGQHYHQPCFGVREFPAQFAPCQDVPPCPEELLGERDLGWMLLDMDYSDPQDIRPMFFRAVLQDGVLVVPPLGGEGVVR